MYSPRPFQLTPHSWFCPILSERSGLSFATSQPHTASTATGEYAPSPSALRPQIPLSDMSSDSSGHFPATIASTNATAPSRPIRLPRRLSWRSRIAPERSAPDSIAAPFSVSPLYPRLMPGIAAGGAPTTSTSAKGR